MPAFVYDGILVGVTLNVVMRNGMVAALALFLAAALALQPLCGNTGLWVAIHLFFIARAGFYWWALEREGGLCAVRPARELALPRGPLRRSCARSSCEPTGLAALGPHRGAPARA